MNYDHATLEYDSRLRAPYNTESGWQVACERVIAKFY